MTEKSDEKTIAVLPKDTVIYFHGEPCRLVNDTPVVNAYMAQVGFEEYDRLTKPPEALGVLVSDQEPLG